MTIAEGMARAGQGVKAAIAAVADSGDLRADLAAVDAAAAAHLS